MPFIQGALFAAINAGTALARDVETGFIKRLAMTPMQRTALLVGQLIGVDGRRVRLRVRLPARRASPPAWTSSRARSACPAIIVLGVLIALGVRRRSARYIGLRSGSGEAVQGFFPLLFVLLFLSSINLPRQR